MTDYVNLTLKNMEETSKNKTKKEQNDLVIHFLSNILEVVTLRHRLISASLETEVLSKQYRRVGSELGFEDFHMFLRYVQFDFAKYKDTAGNPPPVFVSELHSEDSQIDRYVPNSLYLTINELEEGQIGRLSFKGKENIQQVLRPGGIDNLKLILKLQLTHNNALISSIMQANACFLSANLASRINNNSVVEIDSANLTNKNKE